MKRHNVNSPFGARRPGAETSLSRLRRRGIIVPSPGDVRRYLIAHPDITDILEDICHTAQLRLAKSTQLSLELYRDLEAEDEYLTLYARPEQYDDDLDDVLDSVFSEYYALIADTSGWLLLTTDYQPPRARS